MIGGRPKAINPKESPLVNLPENSSRDKNTLNYLRKQFSFWQNREKFFLPSRMCSTSKLQSTGQYTK